MEKPEPIPICPACRQHLDPMTDIRALKAVSLGWNVFICVKCGTILSVGS